jgi:hypothetical protein
MQREPQLTWSTRRECARLFAQGVTVRTAGRVALVVGTILSAVNQGSTIVNGSATWVTWLRVGRELLRPVHCREHRLPLGMPICSR